ncbi:hypothetical protein HYW20_01100 [Candidatus Woesearchaeota archaeon]|nr:hypothetical protein [Candidatus Woesearchaeota archaeon]
MTSQLVVETLRKNYGQGVFCSETNRNEERDFICTLGAVSPVEIVDNESILHFKFLKLNEVGKIVLTKEGKLKYHTKPEDVGSRISQRLMDINSRTENIVLSSIYDKLVKIAMIRTLLNPIYVILKDAYNNEITTSFLKNYPNRYDKYFKFLTEINMIRYSSKGIVEGNDFIQLKKHLEKEDEELVFNKVFGHTVNAGKYYLIDNLKLNILKPFIRVTTSFYSPSIQLKSKVNLTKERLFNHYINQYQLNTTYPQFEGIVDQLDKAEIVKEKNNWILVIDDILKRINKNISEDKELTATYY